MKSRKPGNFTIFACHFETDQSSVIVVIMPALTLGLPTRLVILILSSRDQARKWAFILAPILTRASGPETLGRDITSIENVSVGDSRTPRHCQKPVAALLHVKIIL